MSGFKAVVLWVPEPRRALANAGIMSFGALGVLVATVPTELAVAGGRLARGVRRLSAAITFAVATLIFVAVPEQGASATGEDLARPDRRLDPHLSRPRVLAPGAPARDHRRHAHRHPDAVGGPWFRDVAGLDRIGVANHLMAMALAFLVGILLSGAVADWFVRRGVDLLTVMLGFLAAVPVRRARDRAAMDLAQPARSGWSSA